MPVSLFSNIIVTNLQNQILLVRRSKTAPSRAYDWELPGGIVENNEDPKCTALRELSEEAGISSKRADYIFAGTSSRFKQTGFFFYTKVDNPEPKLSYEHDKYLWVSLDEAKGLVTVKGYKIALEYLENYKHLETIVSTKALVIHNGKTLVLKRSAGDVGGGNWDLPGGRVEPGEDLYGSIKREVYEETSLVVAKSEINFAHTEIVNEEVRIRVGQVAAVTKDEVRLSEEHDEYRWVDSDLYDFMNHPNWPGWGEFVKNYS